MFKFQEIYNAYIKCRKNKRNTINALSFEIDLLQNLGNLKDSLNTYSYTPKRSICFLTSFPKLREVFASDFSDRVVHHIVVLILEQIFEPKFIYDSYSNRKNKGIHKACEKSKHFMRGSKYYLQLDIKNFFYSINKNILFDKLKKEIEENYYKVKDTFVTKSEMIWLLEIIIYNDITKGVYLKGDKKLFEKLPPHKTLFKISKNKALPIGNLTSQFFANVYMNDFDNYIKRKLKVKRYIRYVDDFILFGNSKEELMEKYYKIVDYLKTELDLNLRDRYIIRKNSDGLDFLGYIVRPNYTLTRKRVVNNFKYKKAKFLTKYEELDGKIDLKEIKEFQSINASFLGHIKHSNSYNLAKKVGLKK